MLHSVVILSDSGKTLFAKHFCNPSPPASVVSEFFHAAGKNSANASSSDPSSASASLAKPDATLAPTSHSAAARALDVPPVIPVGDGAWRVHYIVRGGLWFLGIVKGDVPPLAVLQLLVRLCDILAEYIEQFSETSVKENAVVVYELLEEMIDDGFPVTTEPAFLRDLVPPPSLLGQLLSTVNIGTNLPTRPVPQTSPLVWRPGNVKYASNEILFDISEEIDVLMNANGTVVAGDIHGQLNCTSKLSGMPDLLLSFNNTRLIENDVVSFHPCVRYARWQKDHVLSFVPPDGSSTLLKYSVPLQSTETLPILVRAQFTTSKSAGKLDLSLSQRGPAGKALDAVAAVLVMPQSVGDVKANATVGQSKWDSVAKRLQWTVPKIGADAVKAGPPHLTCTFSMTKEDPKLATISVFVDFKIQGASASGLRVDTLQILNENYKPYKGVKSTTKAGRYCIRLSA